MLRLWITLVAAGMLLIAAIAPAASQDQDELTIDLEEIEDSGVSGTATLSSEDGSTTVTIDLSGTPEGGSHPAHIHSGTCDDLGDIVFPLDNVEEGTSETTVEASIDDILAEEHVVNVHLSEDEISTYVACGEIVAAEDGDANGDETPTADETPEGDETPMAEETPEADETPMAEETPEAEETPTAEETPEADETPMAEETPEADETPMADETPEADETPTADEVAPATGSGGGGGFTTAASVILLAAAGIVGTGLLLRRRAVQT